MFKKNNDILNFLLFFVCFFIVLYSQQNIELSLQIFIPKAVKKHQVANIYYSYRSNGLDFSADRRITFAYDNYSSSTFTIKTKLPNILKLDKIRFDPLSKSGQMTIKNIYLKTGFEKKKLDIGKLYKLGSIAAVRSISNVQLVNNELVISAEGSDSYILLIDEIQAHIDVEQIWLKNAVVSSCLAMIGMLLLYFFHFIVKHKTSSKNFPKKLLLLNNNTFAKRID